MREGFLPGWVHCVWTPAEAWETEWGRLLPQLRGAGWLGESRLAWGQAGSRGWVPARAQGSGLVGACGEQLVLPLILPPSPCPGQDHL